jgi:flavin-dependent dehydrogenase
MMAQDEVRRPPTWPDDQVDVFFGDPPGLVFGALIPKGRHLNISLLGHRLTQDAVQEFIENRMAAKPDGPSSGYVSLCGCTPRVGVGPAARYYGDRWAAVGDAAVTRLYKDGIGSAFFLAGRAMETAVTRGVSRRALGEAYAPHCRRVVVDNLYGRVLFRLWSLTLRTPALLRAWSRALRLEGERPPDQRIHQRILWGMFTGDEPYGDLFWRSLRPDALLSLGRSAWRGR